MALSSPLALVAALAALAVPAGSPAHAATAASAVPPRPHIIQRPIPFGTARRRETAAYARRHYGLDTYRLRDPKVIVEHVTVTDTFSAAYNTFAPDRPDAELGELPGTCAHFVVDRDGTIYQLVPIGIICRHTVGLNWTAIGIENVGRSDADVLGRPAQVASLVALTRWLRCREGIGVGNVIGHAESLSSPYHRERVARLRRQTHGDFVRSSMRSVRARLRAAGACAA